MVQACDVDLLLCRLRRLQPRSRFRMRDSGGLWTCTLGLRFVTLTSLLALSRLYLEPSHTGGGRAWCTFTWLNIGRSRGAAAARRPWRRSSSELGRSQLSRPANIGMFRLRSLSDFVTIRANCYRAFHSDLPLLAFHSTKHCYRTCSKNL